MKILHTSRRMVTPPPQVVELITKLLKTPTDDLPQVLGDVDTWRWPRSDLNAWVKVLNKFDALLEEIIRDYDIEKLQVNGFTPLTKQTICVVLRFTRLLMENSTNRKVFSSYDRLNVLFFSSDLDVVILALHVLLRPSQQYSAQPTINNALKISTPRLEALAKRWPYLREYGIGLVDLAASVGSPEIDGLPAEVREVNFGFYRTEAAVSGVQEQDMDTDVFESQAIPRKVPTLSTASGSGAITIHLDEHTLASKSAMDVLADTLDIYSVPDDQKFELLCRIRAAVVLRKGKEIDRAKLVVIRLLAIAIYGHTHSESVATTSLFLYEPDLIGHVAELLQIDRGISIDVQAAALAALDSLGRYRNKNQEVLTAVNAGVNHGILMALVRKTVADIADPDSTIPQSFIEAMLSFVTLITSQASGGNMVVGAGLIPLLIQIIDNKLSKQLPVVMKTMQLLDSILYSFTNAFNMFCTSRGVEALVDRIEHEVDFDIRANNTASGTFGLRIDLPIARSSALKHLLRSMHRMMQSSGTAEGLRGLIDMSLLKSVKKIIENRGVFGANVLPLAINIMATFVHNEPTSLAIIQEAGLPEAFYKTIESGLDPVIEVLQAIPNALGALCLNDVGQAQLARHPSIIPGLLSVFTSERHLKVLLDKENAVLIGTAIDELIRHHPSLKAAVFDALKVTISKIEGLGKNFEVSKDLRQWYFLTPASPPISSVDHDVAMDDVETATSPSNPQVQSTDGDQESKNHDNYIVSFIDVFGRFLEGLFQHTPHCKDFIISHDGLKHLGRLTSLPCLPYDFANGVASDSMVQVMRTMTEISATETLTHLSKLVKESLDETKDFWEVVQEQSKLLPLVDITNEQEHHANRYFRSLVTLHLRITLLSDVFATAGYAHGRAAIGLLQTLMNNMSLQVVSDMGSLHRASVWENIVLNNGLTSQKGTVADLPSSSSPLESPTSMPLTTEGGPSSTNVLNGDLSPPEEVEITTPASIGRDATSTAGGPRERNLAALKHITHGLPSALAPFFQAMVKMFYVRRGLDSAQRKQIADSSKEVANLMVQHLRYKHDGDISSKYAYDTIMLGLYALLLIEERASTINLHTMQLTALYRAGGLDALLDICRAFVDTIKVISKIKEEDRADNQKAELLHAYSGIKVALQLLCTVISSKPLLESGQTSVVVTRDKEDTDPDYFEPHNFLVKLRSTVLPLLKDLWEAPWLISAPLSVSKAVVQAVLELTNGEGEDSKGDASVVEVHSTPGGGIARPPGPDEGRVQILMDMGFPRSAAERALSRTHNNLNAATELLLAHPFPLPPDPEPEQPNSAEPVIQESASEAAPAAVPIDAMASTSAENDQTEAAGPPSTVNMPLPDIVETAVPGKSAEQWKKELDNAREPLRAGLSRQALLLIDEHVSLLFDLHAVFLRPNTVHREQAVQDLVDDIKGFSPSAYDVQEQPLANRCRLLALVLSESPSLLSQEVRATLMDSLLALLLSTINLEHPPRWLAAHLLVTEALFTLSAEPRSITLPKEDEPIVPEAISVGPLLLEAKEIVFDFCLRLLTVQDLPPDELLSTLRLFVFLTRDPKMASQFVRGSGVSLLLKRVKTSAVASSSSYIATILRHVVEDTPTIRNLMQHTVQRTLSQPRGRGLVDITDYVRGCSAAALRDPETFLEVTASLCQLGQPYSSPHVSLKPESSSSAEEPVQPQVDSVVEMQVDQITPAISPITPSESTDSIVHHVIGELMSSTKTMNDILSQAPATIGDVPDANIGQSKDTNAKTTTGDPPASQGAGLAGLHDYMCFLMQCLTELLFSYDSCKLAFLSYTPKKRTQTPAKETGGRYRTATLQFLLIDFITFGTISPPTDEKTRNRTTLCNLAMSVLVALCIDTTPNQDVKDVSPELASVRKFVLEAVSRAIKDLPSFETVEARYGRLFALADLCHRLLTVKINSTSRKQHEENPTHIAKVMLEKGFVATLTTALSEIDLNYPNIRNLVPSILRPLEFLTKIAIKMSRSSGKNKELVEGLKTESISSLSSEDEESSMEEDTGREETPDLYRNSALGMYGGEMDDGHFAEDDMDDDDEDEDEDVEMDFGEDTGSEDTSNTEDDGEDDETRDSRDAWEEDEDEDERLVENDEDDEDEDDREDRHVLDDEDEEGDEEMMWQDIRGEIDEARMLAEEMDDDDEHGVPIQVIHEQDDEPDEIGSDEDDFIVENGAFAEEDIFDFEGFINNNNDREGGGVFVQRQRRPVDDGVQIFGRSRTNAVTPPDATTHPLLVDTSAPTNQSRGPRQPRNGGPTGVVQTIEDLISGGAVQLFTQVMATRGGDGSGPEMIRLEVTPGTAVNLDRGFVQPRRGTQARSNQIRVERPPSPPTESHGRELEPLLTSQRWAQEVKILHGDFVAERLKKLVNHVVLVLLPAAVEAIKEAKIREEDLARRQQEAKAKAEVEEAAAAKAAEVSETPTEERPVSAVESSSLEGNPSVDTISPSITSPGVIAQDHVMEDASRVDADNDMVDTTAEGEDQPSEAANQMEINDPASETPAEPSTTAPAVVERVTVMIHGSAVDITETGIDPTFLEALPDDMREEVLNQHVRDQRAARIERPPDSQISSEFLDALPPEIRAEIIQQEAVQRARAAPGVPAEIDNASFIASLDPTLRQTVLMEQDEGFIQTLPSHMLAEVGAYREGHQSRRVVQPRSTIRMAPAASLGIRKFTPQHDAVRLLDGFGVAVLVRLLFFPHVLKKVLLFKVLVNLCENAKTRTELFNLLLNILQDGTGDLAAVDKSFAQMSFRNTKPQTPRSIGKQKSGPDFLTSLALPNAQNEIVPDLVAQRCLEGLTYIVSSNEPSSLFFLTEHEFPVGLRRNTSRKGKGKEKQTPQTHYPIVLLLGLLDRESLLRTPAIMESVVGLLATVTRPLASLKDRKKVSDEGPSSSNPDPAQVLPAEDSNIIPDPAVVEPDPAAENSSPLVVENPSITFGATEQGDGPVEPLTSGNNSDPLSIEDIEEKLLLANPPQIPHAVLRLIVNILTVGECSGRTFQQSLALIQNLSFIPDARDIIAQELKSKAQGFGQSLSSDLDELATALNGSQGDLLISSVSSKFSPASSVQAKLLRVLKTIDYMYSPKAIPPSDGDNNEDVEKVQAIYESFQFSGLWRRLGDCLSIIEEKPAIEHIATVLLPLIEALMVVCKYVGSKGSLPTISRALRASASPKSPTTPRESMEDLFVSFTDSHRKVLNLMVRNNPSLMSGSFSLLVHNPRVLDFDNKRNYFNQQLHRRPHAREHHSTLQLNVRRARVFEDSFQHLQRKTGEQIKYGKLSVRFYDEEGVDAGGVTREWFQILARQMFDPNNALFQPCAADKLTYQPNKNSWVNPEHLTFFKFVGRVIGKAIYDGRLLDAYFARSLYRQLLGKPVDYKDVEWVDPEYYNSLCWILENDPTALDLTFSVEADEFGVNRIVPLKEGGETLPVTQENKREFVQLSAQYRLYSSIKNQIESLSNGFYEIIPKDLITIFNEQELELLISGTPDIDVDEWRAATEYSGYNSSDPNIVWWWRALKSFNRDERAKVLSFATGTSRVPLSGFVDLQGVQGVQRFSIHKAYGASDRLPQAHTCFNQIDLPQYTSYEMLRQQLLLAINEGGEGFAFS